MLALVSGDDAPVAREIAASVGIEEVYADQSPEDKLVVVERVRNFTQSQGGAVGDLFVALDPRRQLLPFDTQRCQALRQLGIVPSRSSSLFGDLLGIARRAGIGGSLSLWAGQPGVHRLDESAALPRLLKLAASAAHQRQRQRQRQREA